MILLFEQGHVYAGVADRPFFVSPADIQDGAGALGFGGAYVFDRDAAGAQSLRPVADAAARSGHTSDWDTIAVGQWTKATQALELPSAVVWVGDLTAGGSSSSPAAPSTSTKGAPVTLTLEQCAGPWRRFTAVATVAGGLVGLGVGVLLGRYLLPRRSRA